MKQDPTVIYNEQRNSPGQDKILNSKKVKENSLSKVRLSSKTSFQKFEELVGDGVTKTILDAVCVGNLTIEDAEEFANHINPEVRGAFIHARGRTNFVFDKRAVKTMLSKWYEKEAFRLTREQAINRLKTALEESEKADIADELENF